MAIDDCKHSFFDLATTVLPEHMKRMKSAMQVPVDCAIFAKAGNGPRTLAKELGLNGDFSGAYVIISDGTPIYVGISRGVLARLVQHMRGKTHFDASLAYRMARKKMPTSLQRGEAMANPAFKSVFDSCQSFLKATRVAFVKIQNDLEIYTFEAYCALELNTCEWNTFRTH